MSQSRVVYVIGSDDGPKKIGVASNVENRLAGIQTGNHSKVYVLATFDVSGMAAGMVERYAHWLMRDARLTGEWFDVSAQEASSAVTLAISAVQAGDVVPRGRGGRVGMPPERLRECIGILGWTQRGLARMLEKQEATVRQWLSGVVQIPAQIGAWLEERAQHAEATPPPKP